MEMVSSNHFINHVTKWDVEGTSHIDTKLMVSFKPLKYIVKFQRRRPTKIEGSKKGSKHSKQFGCFLFAQKLRCIFQQKSHQAQILGKQFFF